MVRRNLPVRPAPWLRRRHPAPAELTRRLSQIGLVEASEGAKLQAALKPGQRLVSKAGDLWRWDGYRQSAEDAPSSAALRLKQMNRLKELQASLGGAEDVLATAQKAFDENHAALAKNVGLCKSRKDLFYGILLS